MAQLSVVHHTGLERSGGATRVARLLMDGQNGQGVDARLTYEHAEEPDSTPTQPGDFGCNLTNDALAHIHCSAHWPTILASIPEAQKTVITLHDCELLTGGCPYPLHCATINDGCANPCPRNFSHSAEIRKHKHQLLNQINPTLVAPSRWLARLAKTHLYRNVTVIPNGIPWPDRAPSKHKARKALGIHPAARVILFAAHGGTSAVYKSGECWMDIWQNIKKMVPRALCFAVGGDTAKREEDLVVWPYVERKKLALLMAAADALLYPTKADNHSLIILEAMAQALPVVAYSVGGVPEQIMDGQTGMLVTEGHVEEFTQTAINLLLSPSRIRELGQTSFTMGQRRFTVERMVSDYMNIYRKIR